MKAYTLGYTRVWVSSGGPRVSKGCSLRTHRSERKGMRAAARIEINNQQEEDAMEAYATAATVCSTGFAALDAVIGSSGWPAGRAVELFGVRDDAREFMLYRAIGVAQAAGVKVSVIDLVGRFKPEAAIAAGVDLAELIVSVPDGPVDYMVDVLLRLVKVEMEPAHMLCVIGAERLAADAVAQRCASQCMRKLVAELARSRRPSLGARVVIFDTRMDIRADRFTANAFKFFASVRINIGPGDAGLEARVVKNKLAPPFVTVPLT